MENRVAEALEKKYLGKKVKEECTDWSDLEDDCILSENSTIDDGCTEISENMGIQGCI